MDFSKYSIVDEYDTALGDSSLYYSMTENEETFDEKTQDIVQTVIKKASNNGTPIQAAPKNIINKLKNVSSTPIPAVRVTKCKEFEELGVDFLKDDEQFDKNENLSDDEKRKSWDCLANKNKMLENVKKFTDKKTPARSVKFKDQNVTDACISSEVDEEDDDKTLENENDPSVCNIVLNIIESTAVQNDDNKENKPENNVEKSETKRKDKKDRRSKIPQGDFTITTIRKPTANTKQAAEHECGALKVTTPKDNCLLKTPAKVSSLSTPRIDINHLEFSKNLPQLLGSIEKVMRASPRRSISVKKPKTPSSARKTIYSFALRKVSLAGHTTSRKSFLSPNIIAASVKRRRRSVAKPAITVASNQCKYCFKEFKITKALDNHLLENCLKIPPAEKRKLAIENIARIKESKAVPASLISPSSTTGLQPPPKLQKRRSTAEHSGIYRTLKPLTCHSCKEVYPTVYQFAEHMAQHSSKRQ